MDEDQRARAFGIERLITAADKVGNRLSDQLVTAWESSQTSLKPKNQGPWSAQAEALFWPAAEEEFWRRARDQDFNKPQRAFTTIACRLVDTVTDPQLIHLKTVKAVNEAKKNLLLDAAKAEPRPTAKNH